jgi:rubrerythrin
MDIYQFAKQMELEGEQFYRKLALQTENPGLKNILLILADDEENHYQLIEKLQTDSEPTVLDTQSLANIKSFFFEIKEAGADFGLEITQKAVYQQALENEEQSLNFYLDQAKAASSNVVRDLFLKLCDEERQHYLVLEEVIDFISRPETWIENAEFYHLEEY